MTHSINSLMMPDDILKLVIIIKKKEADIIKSVFGEENRCKCACRVTEGKAEQKREDWTE